MNLKLKEKTLESFSAVLPISVIVLLLGIVLVPMEVGTVSMFLVGALMLILGMGFFQLGADMAMMPLGEGLGVQISTSKKIFTVIAIALLMGTIITIAEPDLQVLANQVPAIPNGILIWTVAIGVGIFLVIAVLRILFKLKLTTILVILYVIVFGVSIFTPNSFLAVAFDAGGVTTGPITVPFIMAIGVGLASVRSDKDATDDSFGLVALSSVGPILMVMMLGVFFNPQGAIYTPPELTSVVTTQDVAREFMLALPHFAKEVLYSLLPIAAVFVVLQLVTHRYHRHQRIRIIIGFVYTYIGLVLFLTGVNVGFAPVGSILGGELASSSYKWVLVPVGMLIGYYIVKAEPAIQVLNQQVESITNGSISEKSMNLSLSVGVAVSVGLAMVRSITGISIYWILVPGYIIALTLSHFVPRIFVGIAFDSGGVASGPMTSTFLLPLCIGVCEALGRNVMTDAFGVVALVAMTPLIAVQIMGLVHSIKSRRNVEAVSVVSLEADEILVLEDEEDTQDE